MIILYVVISFSEALSFFEYIFKTSYSKMYEWIRFSFFT